MFLIPPPFLNLCISSSEVIIHSINMCIFFKVPFKYFQITHIFGLTVRFSHFTRQQCCREQNPPKPACALDCESHTHFWPNDQTLSKADLWLSHFHQHKATEFLAQLKQALLYLFIFPFEEFGLQNFRARIPQSASDLTAHNFCKISLNCSKTPALFHLFGPSASLK